MVSKKYYDVYVVKGKQQNTFECERSIEITNSARKVPGNNFKRRTSQYEANRRK